MMWLELLLAAVIVSRSLGDDNQLTSPFNQFGVNLLGFLTDNGETKTQHPLPRSVRFPCDGSRSSKRPSSVHRLRPGDIDVVAALGDSLMAGYGALAEFLPDLFVKYEGVSWTIGGDRTWREFLTLPNILKEFNPNLVGFAVGTDLLSDFRGNQSHFAMGVPQSHDEDLLKQAQRLVQLMKEHPKVDFNSDWKLLTILTGQNDICSGSPCYPEDGSSALDHKRNLQRALDYLKENLPRTFVNLLPVLDITVGWHVEKPPVCSLMSLIECRCLYFTRDSKSAYKMLKRVVKEFHAREIELVESGRYDTKEDFAVVIQPFTARLTPPKRRSFFGIKLTDLSNFSVDCFHLSQKGHAACATMQWNNMLQPVGNKSSAFTDIMETFLCPSPRAPYLFTRKNTASFLSGGRQ